MKKLIAMLLAMVMVLGLVACAAKTEPPAGRHFRHAKLRRSRHYYFRHHHYR